MPETQPPKRRLDQSELGPMTLGNMRSNGPQRLRAWCSECHHHAPIDVSSYPDDVDVQWFQPRVRCEKCGKKGKGITVMPEWKRED